MPKDLYIYATESRANPTALQYYWFINNTHKIKLIQICRHSKTTLLQTHSLRNDGLPLPNIDFIHACAKTQYKEVMG